MQTEIYGEHDSVLHLTIDVRDVVCFESSRMSVRTTVFTRKSPKAFINFSRIKWGAHSSKYGIVIGILSLSLSSSTQWRSYNLQHGTLSLTRELHLTNYAHSTTNGVLLHNLLT